MNKKFSVIVCDPPWSFSDKLKQSDVKRGASSNYNVMTNEDIKKLPVGDLASKDGAILALWVPSSILQTGLDVMKAYGFSHKQTYIWVKTKKDPLENLKKWIINNFLKKSEIIYDKKIFLSIKENITNLNLNESLAFGMGRLFRQTHEMCLIGINNNGIYKKLNNKSQRSVSFAENVKHSAKPNNLHISLEQMFPNSSGNLEIFARRQRSGWLCIGNESPMTEGEDVVNSLQKLNSLSDADYNHLLNLTLDSSKRKELFDFWSHKLNNNSII